MNPWPTNGNDTGQILAAAFSVLLDVCVIDDSYQVSVHLAKGFQRRRLQCEKLTDDRRWMPSDGKSSHCLWQGELKITYVPLKYSLIKIR
jgi:hypothetical protein